MEHFLTLALVLLLFTGCDKGEVETNHTPEPMPEQVTIYNIGDLYDKDGIKGLVFRVNEGGQSGLIVSLSEAESPKAWSYEFIATGSNIRSSGEQNTAIIYSLPDWQNKYPAFVWCKNLGSGWYIPAVNELRELLLISSSTTFSRAISTNNATPFASQGYYLSSTEMDEYWVYIVDAQTRKESANYKQYTYHTRAIRSF